MVFGSCVCVILGMLMLFCVDRKFDEKDVKTYMDRLLRVLTEVSISCWEKHDNRSALCSMLESSN